MTHESSTAILLNSFDVQVDSNHQWDEAVRNVEVSVYALGIDADGEISTDTMSSLAHAEIHNAEAKCEDTWFSSENADEIEALPERWQVAVRKAVETALELQQAELAKLGKTFRYECGQTVFLTEYKFPADVMYYTTDGRYVANMANSGELDIFAEDEIEPYDYDRWNR